MIVTDGKPDVDGYTTEHLIEAVKALLESDNPVLIEIGARMMQHIERDLHTLLSD